MNDPASMARFYPALGRLPSAVAYALFADADWVSIRNPAITTALEAASENIRWEQVQQVIEVLPDDTTELRDKTLLSVAHKSMAPRAELVAIDVADVQFLEDGVATVALRPTKTNLEAERDYRFLAVPTVALVEEWRSRSRVREGALFTAIQRNGAARALLERGQRLTAAHVNQIARLAIARVAQAQGELTVEVSSPAEQRRALLAYARACSGHSPRVGAAQDMAAARVSTAAILPAGGWSDERMVKRYIRTRNDHDNITPHPPLAHALETQATTRRCWLKTRSVNGPRSRLGARWAPSTDECAAPTFRFTRQAWRSPGRSPSGPSVTGIGAYPLHERGTE